MKICHNTWLRLKLSVTPQLHTLWRSGQVSPLRMGQGEMDWSGKHGAENRGQGVGTILLFVLLFWTITIGSVAVRRTPFMEVHFLVRFLWARTPYSSLDARQRHSNSFQSWAAVSGRRGDVIGRQSWFSSHNLDSALAAKMRTCAVTRRLGPGSRAMTQQHLLTRSGILHTIENLPRPKSERPWKIGTAFLGNQVFNAQSPNHQSICRRPDSTRREHPLSFLLFRLKLSSWNHCRSLWAGFLAHAYICPQLLLCRLIQLNSTSHKA